MSTSRIPAGLTFSMLIAALSLAVFVVIWNAAPADWTSPGQPVVGPDGTPSAEVSQGGRGLELVVHASALLCFLWSLSHYLVGMRAPSEDASGAYRDLDAVLTMAALITGLTAVIIMLLVMMTELLIRVFFLPINFPGPWATGLADLGLVSVAAYLGFRHTRHPPLVTLVLWLLVLSGLWAVFQFIPAAERVPVVADIQQTVWTHWAGVFAVVVGGLIALFTAIEGRVRRRWRCSAWPDHLERLSQPKPAWPGFRYSAGVLGVAVLIVGCVHVALPYTFVGAALAGASMCVLAWRQWDANFADAGLGLITLAGVSLLMFDAPRPPYVEGSALAQVFNRALVGLAIMTGLWYWLAGVWRQQLDNGVAWTTAGRMIRPAERTGYLCATFTVLFCLHMAFWPNLPGPTGIDNAPFRWAWGLGGHALALAVGVFATLRTRKAPLGWLSLIIVVSAVCFALIRSPASVWGQVWMTHWPAVLAGAAVLLTGLSALAARSPRWEPFHESLFLSGVIILPMAALAGLAVLSRFFTPGVAPMAFGLLGAAYLIAALALGPRKFLAPAILSLLVGIFYLF